MKYLIGIGIFALGGLGGYLIGSHKTETDLVLESPPTEFVMQTVHDTIVETQIVNVSDPIEVIDSAQFGLDSLQMDSLTVEIALDSGEVEADISIRREKLISTIWVAVDIINEIEKDTLASQLIGVDKTFPTKMLVEFWESPLNFSGYKLSRNKLVMFGMPDNLAYKILRNKNNYFITTENIFYSIRETEEFLPYLEVQKEVVFDD